MVHVTYFEDKTGGLGKFTSDLIRSVDQADKSNDPSGAVQLRDFLLKYVELTLASKNSKQMERYLGSIKVWKETTYWNVYRVPDTPSLVYAAKIGNDNEIHIMVVATCYTYPSNNPETWWTEVVEPRVRSMT